MAEGGDELVNNNLEQNQTLKNVQGKRLPVMEMGLPELPVLCGLPGQDIHSLQEAYYSTTSSTDLKRPLQGAPPLSPLSEDMQDPQVTSTTGREFGCPNGISVEQLPENARAAEAGCHPFQPDSTFSGSGTNPALRTPRGPTSSVPVESFAAHYPASSFAANSLDTSARSPQQNSSMPFLPSPPNDLNVASSPFPMPVSGTGMMQYSGTPNIMFVHVPFFPVGTQQANPIAVPCYPYTFPISANINPSMHPFFQPPGSSSQGNSQPALTKTEISSSSNSSSQSLERESESTSCKPCRLQFNNETRLTSLPLPMVKWIIRKLDDTTAESNWQDVAHRHDWVYSKIRDHKENCGMYQRSCFESLLKKDPFTTYTVGQFKEDMKAIHRMDVFYDFDNVLKQCLVK